jgi:hypothetical protein
MLLLLLLLLLLLPLPGISRGARTTATSRDAAHAGCLIQLSTVVSSGCAGVPAPASLNNPGAAG